MRPSETDRGQAWLSNFIVEDRLIAERLVDSIRFAPGSTIRGALSGEVDRLVREERIEFPALLVPAQAVEDLASVGPDDGKRVAFVDLNLDDPISATPGSEGLIGNVVREATRGVHKKKLLGPSETLESLRSRRCRSILLATDYSGSGDQLVDYATTLTRNSTIRSWRSGGLLTINVLAFATSAGAIKRMSRDDSPIDSVWTVEVAPAIGGRSPDTDFERDAVDLCRRYARTDNGSLGYRSSGGLFATDGGAPNNLPLILRRKSSTKWEGFFEGRAVPAELALQMGDYRPSILPPQVASDAGQHRAAAVLSAEPSARTGSDRLLAVIALLKGGPKAEHVIADRLAVPIDRIRSDLAALRATGLMDADNRLTAAGEQELTMRRRRERSVAAQLVADDSPYYPQSMR